MNIKTSIKASARFDQTSKMQKPTAICAIPIPKCPPMKRNLRENFFPEYKLQLELIKFQMPITYVPYLGVRNPPGISAMIVFEYNKITFIPAN